MIAHGADVALSEVLAHEVEIGFALPVDQVAGVDDVFDVLFRPVERVAQRLFLTAAEGLGTSLMEVLLLLTLMRVGCRQVGV